MAEERIPVDLTNPGHVFACLGFLEAADVLLGDASKAKRILGWEPKVTFKELVRLMVDNDLNIAKHERATAEQIEGDSPP